MIDILFPFATLLIGYILGSIPTAIIIGKLFYKQDIRDYGSHNPGGTNAMRTWGKVPGVLVMLIDMAKAAAAFWSIILIIYLTDLHNIMDLNAISWSIWLTALGTVLGHCYSFILKFKGGKGVATFIGALGTSSFFQFGIGLCTFVFSLLKKKIVGFSSILMVSIATLVAWIMYFVALIPECSKFISYLFICNPNILFMNIAYPIVVTLMAFVVIFRHKENIKKMLEKTN